MLNKNPSENTVKSIISTHSKFPKKWIQIFYVFFLLDFKLEKFYVATNYFSFTFTLTPSE